MARTVAPTDLQAILQAMRGHPEGVSLQQILDAMPAAPPRRTLQYRLKSLVDAGRLAKEGDGKYTRYALPIAVEATTRATGFSEAPAGGEDRLPISGAGEEIRAQIRRPVNQRRPVGYDRAFLDSYLPNRSSYLSVPERRYLRGLGTQRIADQPAGTYARHILNRLLIDLSWNSSRLEGNTYSLLDTRQLINLGEQADGKSRLEAQMILNHKDAIEFLVGDAEDIGFNRYTLLNLHAMLANNLLPDPDAPGRLRHILVGIEGSVFRPLEVPAQIEEAFDQILATAAAITDPFEQAFFVMVHIPYLQPFDDVNKRVSRLAANIPLIKGNLTPLSFEGVPRGQYTEAILGIYELRRTEMLRDLFIWAYERSAQSYAAVRQSLGEPDPFRLQYRDMLRSLIGELVGQRLDRAQALKRIRAWSEDSVAPADRQRFEEMVIDELMGLHEGNFARYRIRPAVFADWQAVWG